MPAVPLPGGALAVSLARPELRSLIEAHGPFVGRTLRYLGVADADVEDVCQEVFIVVFRRFDEFRAEAAVKTWLYGICLRVASVYRRKVSRQREALVAEPPEVSILASQDDALERKDARARLQRLLDSLDEEKRAVFVLYEIERMTMADVAKAVGCPVQTAYYRLHAARNIVMTAFRLAGTTEES